MEFKEKKRDAFIDISKALAMISIIIAHSKIVYVQNIMYMYMVPAFFFFAGFVFNYTDKTIDFPYFRTYFIKKIIANWVPFVQYSAMFILLHNAFIRIGIYTTDPLFATVTAENQFASLWGGRVQQFYSFRDGIRQLVYALSFGITEEFTRPLWFLPALFVANIAFALIFFVYDKAKKHILNPVLVLFLFLLGYTTHLPRYISTGLVGVLFVYAGHLFRKNRQRVSYKFWMFAVSAVIVILMSRFTSLGMMSNKYTSPFTLILSSACGIYCILFAAKWIEKKCPFLSKHLAFYGRNTLMTLAFHLLFFKCISAIQILYYKADWIYLACYPVFHAELPWPILYSIIGIIGTYLIAFVYDQAMKRYKSRSKSCPISMIKK